MVTKPSRVVSYTAAANNSIPAFFEFPGYVFRNKNVSSVSTGGRYQEFS